MAVIKFDTSYNSTFSFIVVFIPSCYFRISLYWILRMSANYLVCGSCFRELKWNEREKIADLSGTFDHIICADWYVCSCIYFDIVEIIKDG